MSQPVPDDPKAIIAAMKQLENEAQKLAPHPDKPEDTFVYAKADARASGGDDSILGSMMGEEVLSIAIGGMLPGIPVSFDLGNAVEAVDEAYTDRHKTRTKRNMLGKNNENYDKMMEQFLKDRPHRLKLEMCYMALSKKLDIAMSAPKPDMNPEQKKELNRLMEMQASSSA